MDDESKSEEAGPPSFKEVLRAEPHLDDFPDTADLRDELPQDRDLGFED